MPGSVMEHHLMTGITEKSSATDHRGQNAALAFDAQVFFQTRQVSDPTDQGLGLMRVQPVTDDMPATGLQIGGDHGLQMRQEIGFGASGSTGRSQDAACYDIAADDEGARAMPHILKFSPLDLAWSQRQARMLAFEGLHSRQLVGTHGLFSLLGSLRRLFIHGADGFDLPFALRIWGWRQPVPDQVWLEIPFFNRRAACRGEICLTIPRAIASSAISR